MAGGSKAKGYKVLMHQPLRVLFNAVEQRYLAKHPSVAGLKFVFDGRTLSADSTPEQLDMDDEDILDASPIEA